VKRIILGIVAGIVAWVLAASLLNRGVRLAQPGYASAELNMTFTLSMMAARLILGALASLIAGTVAGWIDRPGGPAAWIVGAMLLAAFIPTHVGVWDLFPVWYHLTFLVTLVPLILLGSLFARGRAPGRPADGAQRAA
jgi:hypothetical protein